MRPLLHDAAPVHHKAPVADLIHHVQIVGDKQVRQPVLSAQPGDELQYLSLNGDIQRRHRLVSDDEPRLLDQRRANAPPLPLAAGFVISALAIATLCCCPPDSSDGYILPHSGGRPTSFMISATRRRTSAASYFP